MQAVRWVALNQMRFESLPIPEPGPGEVLVKIHTVGVCGTDVDLFHYAFSGLKPGVILGHELAGDVVDVGQGVTGIAVGQRVAVEPSVPCGRCDLCREGRFNLCRDFKHLGQQIDGAFREYLTIAARNVYPLPGNLSYDAGALVEPVGCCVHALDRARVQMGETAVLVGDGFFGLLFTRLLKVAGVSRVAVLGHHDMRLEMARTMGADLTVNTHHTDPAQAVADLAGPRGVDLCLELAGNSGAVQTCIDMLRPGGRILLFSGYTRKVEADFQTVVGKELELIAANASPNVWNRTIDLMAKGLIRPEDVVTHRFPLARLDEAFVMAENKSQAVKVIVHP